MRGKTGPRLPGQVGVEEIIIHYIRRTLRTGGDPPTGAKIRLGISRDHGTVSSALARLKRAGRIQLVDYHGGCGWILTP